MKHMQRYRVNLQFFSGEKTEKATPQKRKEARNKGQVAKSIEVSSALILLLVFLFLWVLGQSLAEGMTGLLRRSLTEYLLWDLTVHSTDVLFKQLSLESVKILFPVLLISLLAGFVASYIQIGFLFTTEPLKMKLEKLNPIEGAKRMLALRSLVELVKSILKITLTSAVAFMILWRTREELMMLGDKGIGQAAAFIGSTMVKLGLYISIVLMVLAILDYMYQKYDHEKQLRMSKQEVKEEYKKMEGDPKIKGKIKEKQRQMAMSRMMSEVPKADVVITNPTHFAVAISYQAGKMEAPVVVAKGKDYVALKIKEKAKEHGVITMENKPLARALYAQTEIGEQIPEELFKAVAEVLAFVYRLKGKA